jgi:hypothetical protein
MKHKTINPTRSQFNILSQICNFIPPQEVSKIARATGAQDMSRTFKPWSHVVSLVYAQLTLNGKPPNPSQRKGSRV